LFVAEGLREVDRALATGLVPRAIYVAPELLPEWTGPAAEKVSARVLAKMAYRAEPEGLIGVFEAPKRELPADATLVVVAVQIEKPGNLGAMARTTDAAGADALLVAGPNFDPWNPNAIRASTGAVFTLPIVEVTQADVAALPHAKVAAVLGSRTAHTEADYTRRTAFLIGAEDVGLGENWRQLADTEVSIPMKGTAADSLNASTAAAVLLFEAVRQRAASSPLTT
jgi:TrmH family RNA methyltransferase